MWIDTHCHLDASAFDADRDAMRRRARAAGVARCVIPSVRVAAFDGVRALAQRLDDGYALGIHPLCVAHEADGALDQLDASLTRHADDPRLVAVGEIGLDYFVPQLKAEGALRRRHEHFFRAQLDIARAHRLPVLLHVRRSVEAVLLAVRAAGLDQGIAHAFSGSRQQADQFLALGLRLGFGGAMTYDRAGRLRKLAAELPADAIVMETDAPDIPPQWIYQTAAQRAAGARQGRNEPAQIPRIGAALAALRGVDAHDWAAQTSANALAALPRLRGLPIGSSA